MDMANQPKPQDWIGSDVPDAASALPRTGVQPGSRVLLYMRPACLSARLAQGFVERRTKQESGVALCLRHCLAILERTE
jgi:hypothetical protein